jgi:prepilin-type N-terminal cleavage/methylation domain-containing protein
MKREAGYSLIELVVAIVIVSVGLLAMAGTASMIITTMTSSQTQNIASAVAEARFERLRSVACTARSSGTATTRGIKESWTRVPVARADDVTVTVTMLSYHRSKTQTFQSYLPC